MTIREKNISNLSTAALILERTLVKAVMDKAKAYLGDIDEALLARGELTHGKNFGNQNSSVTLVAESTTTAVDTKAMRNDFPDLVKKYTVTRTKKAYLR